MRPSWNGWRFAEYTQTLHIYNPEGVMGRLNWVASGNVTTEDAKLDYYACAVTLKNPEGVPPTISGFVTGVVNLLYQDLYLGTPTYVKTSEANAIRCFIFSFERGNIEPMVISTGGTMMSAVIPY